MLLEKIQLEPNEEILQTVRKHWFILFSELFGVLVMLLAPLFVIMEFISFLHPCLFFCCKSLIFGDFYLQINKFIKFVLHLSSTFFILYKCTFYTQSFPSPLVLFKAIIFCKKFYLRFIFNMCISFL